MADTGAELEYCFVDDGSTDGTLCILKKIHEVSNGRVHYISLSRHFGKEAALLAGLDMARGDYVVTMDADMQDPPDLLPKMWKTLTDEGSVYDSVAAYRTDRKGEPHLRSVCASLFYKMMNSVSSTPFKAGERDFRMMNRVMVDAVIADREYNRFSKGIFSWVGFRTFWIPYENVVRNSGKTKWSFWNLFAYSMEGVLAYTTIPLYLSSGVGIIMFLLAVMALFFIFFRALLYGDPVAGWPSLVCIITLLGGVILLAVGNIGLYMAKIYMETKKRPIYIIREKK